VWQDIDLGEVRRWARADWIGPLVARAAPATGVSTDTRSLAPGQVFVALRGERFDGHEHVAAAFEAGASAVVVKRTSDVIGRTYAGPMLAVDSPLAALGRLARQYRRRFDIPVIAVTGSAGKTTAKEMITAVLGRRFRVLSTPSSENNEIGVPRTILGLTPEHGAAVIEMGARRVGDIAYLCRIVQPNIGVLLNIGTAHLEVFGSVGRVAKAKGELLDFIVDKSYVALVNADDCVIAGEAMRTKGRLLGFGWTREGHFSGEGLVLDQEGCGHFSLQNTSFHLRIPGRHNAHNALAAIAVADQCGLSASEAAAALAEFEPVSRRSEILRKAGIRVINDCHNANPGSVRAALDLIAEMPVEGRRIAVLGDMLELGEQATALHEDVGRYAVGRVDILLSTGPLSVHTVRAAREAGIEADRAGHFDDRDSLTRQLKSTAVAGDLVLIKASRGMELEHVVEAL
jgi:UDP-N-acetylmuramoyl-tripeptide--D-alanyl-D-alanine ligase